MVKPDIEVYIVKGGYVGDKRIEEAYDAINTLDSQLDMEANIAAKKRKTYSVQDNVHCNDRPQTREDVERQLHNDGYLSGSNIVMVIHDCAGISNDHMQVAGCSMFRPFAKDVSARNYQDEDGQYCVCFTNATTRHIPYNLRYFKNTVIHELGHVLMDLGIRDEHTSGAVWGDDEASPMCTWYVESDESIYVSNPDLESEQAYQYGDWDNSGHDTNISYKAEREIENHIGNNWG